MSKLNDDQHSHALRELVTNYETGRRNGDQPYLGEEQLDDLLTYYYGLEDFDAALEVCDLAVERFRFTPDFYKWKALLHKILAQEDDAMAALDQLNIYAPHDYEVQLLRLEVMVHFEHCDESRELLESLQATCEEDHQLSILAYYDAVLLLHEDQAADAFLALCNSLRYDPWQEVAYEELCHEPAFSTYYPKLVSLLKELTQVDAFNDMLWYYLGVVYDQLGDDLASLEALDYARSLDDQHPDYVIDYADKLYELENYARALDFYNRYQQLPEALETYDTSMRIGRCYQMLDRTDEAIKAFLQAVELNPRAYDGFQHLGECYALREQWGQAAYYYNQAVTRDDHPAICWLGLACCQAAISENMGAEEAFIKATEHTPEFSDAYVTYALFLIDQGRERDAIAVIEGARREYLDATLAYGAVAIYCLCNRRRHGLYLLTEALDEYPESRELLYDWYPELEEDREVQTLLAGWE